MRISITSRIERLRGMRAANRFAILLSAQLLLILLSPLAGARGLPAEVYGPAAIAVFFAGLHLVTEHRRQRRVGVLLLAPLAVAGLLYSRQGGDLHLVAMGVLGILFVGFVTGVILWELLTTPRVTAETLYGAIVGYLFTGIVFGMLYMLVEQLIPGSLRFTADPARRLAWVDASYFSFITLTTIGYGDLAPFGEVRALVLLEGIIGAMYPPVVIGRLLASYQPRHGREGFDAVVAEARTTGPGEAKAPARAFVGDGVNPADRGAMTGDDGETSELHAGREIVATPIPRKRGT